LHNTGTGRVNEALHKTLGGNLWVVFGSQKNPSAVALDWTGGGREIETIITPLRWIYLHTHTHTHMVLVLVLFVLLFCIFCLATLAVGSTESIEAICGMGANLFASMTCQDATPSVAR